MTKQPLLEQRGFKPEQLKNLHTSKGSNTFTPDMRDIIMALRPAGLLSWTWELADLI